MAVIFSVIKIRLGLMKKILDKLVNYFYGLIENDGSLHMCFTHLYCELITNIICSHLFSKAAKHLGLRFFSYENFQIVLPKFEKKIFSFHT